MAQYVDVKDVEKLIKHAIEDSWELDYTLEKLKEINKADVIERYEYEYLKKENRELAIKYDNAMNMVINEQENVTRLRAKIDKAIAEMESIELVMFCDEMRDYCVDILKRNIGE